MYSNRPSMLSGLFALVFLVGVLNAGISKFALRVVAEQRAEVSTGLSGWKDEHHGH